MRNKSLGYAALVALTLALIFGAHRGIAQPPQAAGGPAPGNLPDILGITTGISAQQALDLLRAHDPGHTVVYGRWTIPQMYGDKNLVGEINTATSRTDNISVLLTPPPLDQRVWAVHRVLRVMAPRAGLVNELLQKYGAHVWAPGPNPPNANTWTWLVDETGQPVNAPSNQADKYKMRDCVSQSQIWEIGAPLDQSASSVDTTTHPYSHTTVVQAVPSLDPAIHHVCDNVVMVYATLSGSEPNWIMDVRITDYTMQHRAAKVLNDTLNAIVQKGSQQQRTNASQQALPQF
jgi:hypothetical protein